MVGTGGDEEDQWAWLRCDVCKARRLRLAVTPPCCPTQACRPCAFKRITELRRCWRCGDAVSTADLTILETLRAVVSQRESGLQLTEEQQRWLGEWRRRREEQRQLQGDQLLEEGEILSSSDSREFSRVSSLDDGLKITAMSPSFSLSVSRELLASQSSSKSEERLPSVSMTPIRIRINCGSSSTPQSRIVSAHNSMSRSSGLPLSSRLGSPPHHRTPSDSIRRLSRGRSDPRDRDVRGRTGVGGSRHSSPASRGRSRSPMPGSPLLRFPPQWHSRRDQRAGRGNSPSYCSPISLARRGRSRSLSPGPASWRSPGRRGEAGRRRHSSPVNSQTRPARAGSRSSTSWHQRSKESSEEWSQWTESEYRVLDSWEESDEVADNNNVLWEKDREATTDEKRVHRAKLKFGNKVEANPNRNVSCHGYRHGKTLKSDLIVDDENIEVEDIKEEILPILLRQMKKRFGESRYTRKDKAELKMNVHHYAKGARETVDFFCFYKQGEAKKRISRARLEEVADTEEMYGQFPAFYGEMDQTWCSDCNASHRF